MRRLVGRRIGWFVFVRVWSKELVFPANRRAGRWFEKDDHPGDPYRGLVGTGEEIKVNTREIEAYFAGKVVMVTGAAGSIGSAMPPVSCFWCGVSGVI